MKRMSASKLKEYQSQGYWKGLTLEQCHEFEKKGYWPGVTLQEYFERAVKDFPDNEAIIYENKRITFREYKRAVDNMAANLLKLGVKKGDTICVQLHNCPEFFYLQIALPKIGAIMQPIHTVYRALEVRKRLDFCEARGYVVPAELGGFNFAELGLQMKDELKGMDLVLVVPEGKDVPKGAHNLTALCEKADLNILQDYLKGFEADPNDLLLMNFTSGTESDPKGFLHTHNTIVGWSKFFCDEVCHWEKGKEVLLSFSPMTHTFGWLITLFGVIPAAKVIVVQMFSPTQTLSLVSKEKITYMQGTPTHLSRFLNHEDYSKHDVSTMRLYLTGGAAIPPSLVTQFREVMPNSRMMNGFGMGEDLTHTIVVPEDPPNDLLESVGRPFPNGSEVGIFDEKHQPLPQGQIGEIGYRGPNMFLAYFKNPEKTDATRGDDGWFYTGDSGYLDEKGRLRLHGRKKEMINKGGSKVFPLTVENIICFHPKVLSVAVVGIPDPDLGERVCACIIPKPGETVTLEDIVAYMKEKGAGKYDFPDVVKVMEQFPMTPTGKIKKDLIQKEISGK